MSLGTSSLLLTGSIYNEVVWLTILLDGEDPKIATSMKVQPISNAISSGIRQN